MLALLLALSCPVPKMQNITKEPWTAYDRKEMKWVEKRCGELYPDARCVKLFRKFGHREYTVICGAAK
jgi:hypothetical protein